MSEPLNSDAMRANLDQIRAVLRDFAPVVAEYWLGLIAAGMSQPAATQLAIDWVRSMFKLGNG